ncbi:response regulator [Rhodohalobacter mucosus]|uniref:Response regulator n=1 Tax=Rhodohalobacter mucosus TaxID=2079485 RepID=A0A316TP17_9BACT|nr:response regulator [Rhodohalobacter mucosus]PWN05401.1 response regulator [Rhodohalobacter mucosus]
MEKKKVVIVEDDRLLAIVLRKMAKSMNFEVVSVAHGGEDAIRMVEKHRPDLIMMDIMLADSVTGVEAMQKIRQHSDVPVIYISAQTDADTRRTAMEVTNSFYLMKPVNIHELKSALVNVQFAAA